MAVRVLVVDDSSFFRKVVSNILMEDTHIEVIGTAVNGADAIEKVEKLKPDVVTMDIEMPVMDGITAVRRIMALRPTPILMFSSLTTSGAQATLDALDAGALDFLPKKFDDLSHEKSEVKRILCARVRILAAKGLAGTPVTAQASLAKKIDAMPGVAAHRPSPSPLTQKKLHDIKVVAIGTSTGGPVALQQVLAKLPKEFPLPILLVQHMPASFTGAFAQRLNKLCAIGVKEAEEGDVLVPGMAFLAPGGKQMLVEQRNGKVQIHIQDGLPENTYKPSVDITFSSIAKVYPGHVLGVILTGMGADGREGSRLLKSGGSPIWVQDEQSCVVYGMPMAVAEAGLADQVMSLTDIGSHLAQRI
jgi:two-component system chemotaxis response regulator CheB